MLEETSKHYKGILNEYHNSSLNKIIGAWEFIPIYDILNLVDDNISIFDSVHQNITYAKGYDIISLGFSILNSNTPKFPHIDKHFEIDGFKRYHLPLQLTNTSYLYVKEDGSEKFNNYPWELGTWSEFNGLDKVHYPLNGDKEGKSRIILILDIIEGVASDSDVYDYYSNTEELGWTKDIDFRPYYEKYVLNKKNN